MRVDAGNGESAGSLCVTVLLKLFPMVLRRLRRPILAALRGIGYQAGLPPGKLDEPPPELAAQRDIR
jgi:hypothetical protein